MNNRGIMIKFVGEEVPSLYTVDENLISLNEIESALEQNKRYLFIPSMIKNMYINLDRVEYIKFIYE